MHFRTPLIATLIAATCGTAALAGGHANSAVTARKAHMNLYQHNLTILGNMARGNTEYDAEAAGAAASNIVALTQLSQAGYWDQGTDAESIEGTRASPDLWQNFPDVIEKAQAVSAAAVALEAAAGDGAEALGAAVGALGGACTACHRSYRLQ